MGHERGGHERGDSWGEYGPEIYASKLKQQCNMVDNERCLHKNKLDW